MAESLWQDILWGDYGYNSLQFAVYKGTSAQVTPIYQGVGVAGSNGAVSIRLNDIFASALKTREISFIATAGIAANENGMGAQTFVVKNLNTNEVIQYGVIADYSYETFSPLASDPIRLLLDRRQHFFVTNWDNATNLKIRTTSELYSAAGYRTLGVGPSSLRSATSLQVELGGKTITYKVQNTCADYVLHYVNKFGGWDSLLMLGRCEYKEDYQRHNIGRSYSINSSNSQGIGVVTHLNEVTKKWVLRTGLLTDQEASRMCNILGTTRAILEDLNSGATYPVNVTNSSYEEQTFRGNGNKMAQYEINVELAQQHIRR